MQPFDGENTRSILVLDNCSVHHVQEVSELLDEAGILHFFLPPYSPDFNPTEEMFSYIKYYLKNHDEVLQSMQDPIPLLEAAFNSVTQEQCSGWISACTCCTQVSSIIFYLPVFIVLTFIYHRINSQLFAY